MTNNKKNNEVGRREFLGKALGATLSLAVVPSILTCACDAFASNDEPFSFGMVTVDLNATANKALLKDTGSAYVPIPGNPKGLIVNRISKGNFVVMTGICTHDSNRVGLYNDDQAKPDRMVCTGHASTFDIIGTVLTGPADKSLPRYTVTFDGNHTLTITDTPFVSVNDTAANIASLEQNYPNPFNQFTTISFTLSANRHVVLTIEDVQGNTVTTLLNRQLELGPHSIKFNNTILSSGTYLYRLATSDGVLVKRMQVIK